MKTHPHRTTLMTLSAEARGLRNQASAIDPRDPNAMRLTLERMLDQHIALLAVVGSMAADLYPVGVPQQPGER